MEWHRQLLMFTAIFISHRYMKNRRWFLRFFIDSLCIRILIICFLEIRGASPCIQHQPERQWQAERTSFFVSCIQPPFVNNSISQKAYPYHTISLPFPYSFVMLFLNVYETCGFLCHFPSDKMKRLSACYPPAKYQSVKNKISETNNHYIVPTISV